MSKPRLLASFSGGRTSAYMTKWLLDNKSDEYEIVVVFANSTQEHKLTLKFIDECDRHFGFNTVWIESVPIIGQRASSGHRVVTYERAGVDGRAFEAMIAKYGIPNKNFPHCTRELKLNPIKSYLKSIGWEPGSYLSAVGIRTDETRRVSKSADAQGIIYPLIDMIPTDKQDVLDWWEGQAFDLQIREEEGNCTWCWKKSFAKHFMLIDRNPEFYDFPRRMEELHGATGAGYTGEPRKFFRLNLSTDDLFAHAKLGSVQIADRRQLNLDLSGGCSESCEMYTMNEAA